MKRLVRHLFRFLTALFLMAVIAASIMDTEYTTEQSTQIKAELNTVMDNLSSLKNRQKWHPIFRQDILANIQIEATKQGLPTLVWASQKHETKGSENIERIGEKLVEIKQMEPDKHLTKKLIYRVSQEQENLTKVILTQKNYFPIPFNFFARAMNQVQIEEQAINNLKSLKKFTETESLEEKESESEN